MCGIFFLNGTHEHIHTKKKNRVTDAENKLMVSKVKG